MKKEKKTEEGAPGWMVTFGDMMSLLLCFFVLIVSMSEIKQEERFQKVKESIKRAFGYQGGVGYVPGAVAPTNTVVSPMPQLIMRKFQLHEGKTSEEGIEGENPSVRMVREGLEYTIGGQVAFEPGRARLLEGAKKHLDSFADIIRGQNNKIRIRGHAASKSPEMYQPFRSLDDLSYARALAVKDYLVEKGIWERRITVEACGANEPLRTQAYTAEAQGLNRRVSIIVTEMLVEDYQGRPPARTGELTDG